MTHSCQTWVNHMLFIWPKRNDQKYWVIHVAFSCLCQTWCIQMRDMTHSYENQKKQPAKLVAHDSFICQTWLIHVCDMTHPYDNKGMTKNNEWFMPDSHFYFRNDAFKCATWLIHMTTKLTTCNTEWLNTHSGVMYDSFTCLRFLIYTTSTKKPVLQYWVTHDSFTWQIWFIYVYVRHDSFMYVWDMTHSCMSETWLIHVCLRHDSFCCRVPAKESWAWDTVYVTIDRRNLFICMTYL